MIALEKVVQKRKKKIKSFLVEKPRWHFHNILIWARLIWRASHQSCKGKITWGKQWWRGWGNGSVVVVVVAWWVWSYWCSQSSQKILLWGSQKWFILGGPPAATWRHLNHMFNYPYTHHNICYWVASDIDQGKKGLKGKQ